MNMIEMYFYIPSGEAENAVECGLKLSRWADRCLNVGNECKKYISALLNPKDDREKYDSEDFRCLKLELPIESCEIADRSLYIAACEVDEVMDIYIKSIIPARNYVFGMYRIPEVLVPQTVLPDRISLLDKRRDTPVLFDDSQELYINNLIESFREDSRYFHDALMELYLSKLCRRGKIKRIACGNVIVFDDKKSGKFYTVRSAEIDGGVDS